MKMGDKKILIVGSGISGISAAQMLRDKFLLKICEKSDTLGGLIRCEEIDGYLYHKVGGHVFNSKIPKVLDWFWPHFDQENEFISARRNSKILWNNRLIGYPIEDYIYQMDEKDVRNIIADWIELARNEMKDSLSYPNFESFLKGKFGKTLYELYFKPYNQKIWQTDLSEIPMEWLEGKLPMPDMQNMLFHNLIHREETDTVHSSSFYPQKGGSQFIINRLSEGLTINTNHEITSFTFQDQHWIVNGESFDAIIYTGDVRKLPGAINLSLSPKLIADVQNLKSIGISNMLCQTDPTDISWLYISSPNTKAHRIIYTGNLSSSNNKPGARTSCVVEFSGNTSEADMLKEIKKLPGNLKPVSWNYEPNAYIIHTNNSRETISILKSELTPYHFYLLGRFAEWEYFNMDKCIESAINLTAHIINETNS